MTHSEFVRKFVVRNALWREWDWAELIAELVAELDAAEKRGELKGRIAELEWLLSQDRVIDVRERLAQLCAESEAADG